MTIINEGSPTVHILPIPSFNELATSSLIQSPRGSLGCSRRLSTSAVGKCLVHVRIVCPLAYSNAAATRILRQDITLADLCHHRVIPWAILHIREVQPLGVQTGYFRVFF